MVLIDYEEPVIILLLALSEYKYFTIFTYLRSKRLWKCVIMLASVHCYHQECIIYRVVRWDALTIGTMGPANPE